MRIVAGKHRSRVLKTLEGADTRPTSDKVKEAVFSKIGPYFEGGIILDLFSGSGNIALEAISRGFEKAIMADKAKKAVEIIKGNVALLKEEAKCEIWLADYKKALSICQKQQLKFDLIYLDPPYQLALINELVDKISKYDLLQKKGIIVCESLEKEDIRVEKPYLIEKQASYGTVKVTYIRKE
ncbi:MAG TPA: 16S rRNA (guanine(966)-N(2))-methyltransferase RsmD [Erysipelotrichaceae bacterium]|mgnify:CR=1 FL=1|jgi:16S rRNA (guanine966-N2)-methyltransferase|nr:16S rRNA (guanine(966)-N(2))-methyltransferase RsmD [Erysipelotrichaceae bacterium]HQB32413.1 16S rRNA (guanine(966)-N(2))-methyltransferase RsmD [Erysipelotrichaceae bacterium]